MNYRYLVAGCPVSWGYGSNRELEFWGKWWRKEWLESIFRKPQVTTKRISSILLYNVDTKSFVERKAPCVAGNFRQWDLSSIRKESFSLRGKCTMCSVRDPRCALNSATRCRCVLDIILAILSDSRFAKRSSYFFSAVVLLSASGGGGSRTTPSCVSCI